MRSTLMAGPRALIPAPGDTVYDTLRRSGVPVASSCDGSAVCGRCAVQVVEGTPDPATPDELRVLRANRARAGDRLACCLRSDQVDRVHTSYWPGVYPRRVQGS